MTAATTFADLPGWMQLFLAVSLVVAGMCIGLGITGWDQRDYSAEVPQPPSNVTVVEPTSPQVVARYPDGSPCCAGCAAAADLHAIRLLPEVTG